MRAGSDCEGPVTSTRDVAEQIGQVWGDAWPETCRNPNQGARRLPKTESSAAAGLGRRPEAGDCATGRWRLRSEVAVALSRNASPTRRALTSIEGVDPAAYSPAAVAESGQVHLPGTPGSVRQAGTCQMPSISSQERRSAPARLSRTGPSAITLQHSCWQRLAVAIGEERRNKGPAKSGVDLQW